MNPADSMPRELASKKQTSWIFDLVCRHPDFQKRHHYDVWEAEDSWIVEWLNDKYQDYVPVRIEKLEDLDKETASALITHLQLGEQERFK